MLRISDEDPTPQVKKKAEAPSSPFPFPYDCDWNAVKGKKKPHHALWSSNAHRGHLITLEDRQTESVEYKKDAPCPIPRGVCYQSFGPAVKTKKVRSAPAVGKFAFPKLLSTSTEKTLSLTFSIMADPGKLNESITKKRWRCFFVCQQTALHAVMPWKSRL